MKAQVYVVEVNGHWQASATIHPEVDKQFWMNGEFGKTGRLNGKMAESGWLLREPLPLGDACLVAQLWEEGLKRRREKKADLTISLNEMGYQASSIEALELLLSCVEEAKQCGLDERKAAGSRRWWHLGSRGKRQSKWNEESLLGLAERWELGAGQLREQNVSKSHDLSVGELRELSVGKSRDLGVGKSREISHAVHSAVREQSGERERTLSEAELGEIAAGAKLAAGMMQGRALLRSEAHALLAGAGGPGAAASWSGVLQLAALLGRVRLSGSIAAGGGGRLDALGRRRRERSCLRCGSCEAHMHRTACAACGRLCAYCAACIGMGRSRECELLVVGQHPALLGVKTDQRQLMKLPLEQRLKKWSLSPAQAAAAAKALRFVEEYETTESPQLSKGIRKQTRDFLLWAVTGAGKTEMIFPLVESVLLRGGKALIATPRRDVVIELDPRIRKAFPAASVVTLYGGSEQRWENGDITLATTHQLLRFYQGFDLVVVDELDAFPYAGDPILHYAADKSCAPGAARLLLSATPPNELQRAAKRGKLPHARVPVRYHRRPLPVPQMYQTPAVKQMLHQRRLPSKLLAAMQASIRRDAQLFVFLQQIAQTEPMAALLRAVLQLLAIEATSSQDAGRTEKVQRFRAREIRVLVTTTILERGVTIPRSDVYILDADGRLFDEASLVQMAGRAGRSAEDPFGRVYFCSRERNRSQLAAVRHIQKMNRMARKEGYLLPASKGGSSK
ncbi:DEAD/DEAH box helicase [Paenibacillus sp. PL91]|uniref:DEAD/DEAH box helicase n=1 Tax=Paenibacillus sp. PL91 TaxID=2729538 RepID=UPI001CB99C23|nr:helicase-related protein [Paenibacillus sp. PL91]